MEQLLLHLLGDYLTQTDWMASKKTTHYLPALIHAIVYSLPFLLLSPSLTAFLIIITTHYFIDRYRLAKYLIFAKNWITDRSIKWEDCSETGYRNSAPIWLTTWLLIITDNFCHLAINYSVLRWL